MDRVGNGVYIGVVGGAYFRFQDPSSIPPGTRTYSSLRELLEQHTKEQLERLYSAVNNKPKECFRDKAFAAEALWASFGTLPFHTPAPVESLEDEDGDETEAPEAPPPPPTSNTRTREKRQYHRKRGQNKYILKPSTARSEQLISLMTPQAKACVEIIRSTGRTEYLEDELRALLDLPENLAKLNTTQTSWRIFQYYRGKLIEADVLIER